MMSRTKQETMSPHRTLGREEEAGLRYLEGSHAVRAGGHELGTLASHLIIMINGIPEKHEGPLWPVRIIPPDHREIRLNRFIDYLRKPNREGLGLPSLYFLRQVLKASPRYGDKAIGLVREELAKDGVDFDAVAEQEHTNERDASDKANQRPVGPHIPHDVDNVHITPRPTGNSVEAALRRLRKDRPDLHERVMAGEMSANAAAIEAGWRRKPTPFEQMQRLAGRMTKSEIRKFQRWLNKEHGAP